MSGQREVIESISTELASVSLAEDRIIEIRFIHEYEVQPTHIATLQKAMRTLGDGNILQKVLVVPGRYGGISKEARDRDMFDFPNRPVDFSVAIVSTQLHQRLLGSMYFKLNPKKYRFKFFKSEEEARNWLLND